MDAIVIGRALGGTQTLTAELRKSYLGHMLLLAIYNREVPALAKYDIFDILLDIRVWVLKSHVEDMI